MAGTLTVKTTNRTIEVSLIDSGYMMPQRLNVQSVVFISGIPFKAPDVDDVVEIIENSIYAVDPVKVKLYSGDGEPRVWYTYQRLQLGFTFENGIFSLGSKVIFNIGELKGQ